MDHYRALHPKAVICPRPEAKRCSPHTQRLPLRAEDRLYLGRCAARFWLSGHMWASVQHVVPGRHLGAALAGAVGPARCPRQVGMDASVLGRPCRPGGTRGTGIGKTKVGKGSTVMVVADGQGLLIGLHGDSARPHERTLAETVLATVQGLCRRGRPRTRPTELIAARAYESQAFRRYVRRRGIKPPIPTCARRPRQGPKRGRPIRAQSPTTATGGRSNAALGGWITIDGWWGGTSVLWTIAKPSASWPSSCGV
jgi:hypothetical protein